MDEGNRIQCWADPVFGGLSAAVATNSIGGRVDANNLLRSVTIVNACIDWTDVLTVIVRNPIGGIATLISPCMEDIRLSSESGRIQVPPIPPWGCVSILWDDAVKC
ncbi:MAG: hypothetical protein ACYCYM_09420 [Saccharofermentanales bacterium]